MPGTSLVAETVKPLPTVQGTRVQSLGWEDPPEKEIATYSSTLAWKIPWTEETGSSMRGDPHSLWCCKRSDMTEQLALTYTSIHLCMEVRVQNEIFS